jgi:hypothetical protein
MKGLFLSFAVSVLLLSACAQQVNQSKLSLSKAEASYPTSEWNVIPDDKNLTQPSVTDILARAAKKYADVMSYQDKGTITNFVQADYIRGSKKEFHTQFDKQSDRFRFEFWELNVLGFREGSYVIWKNKDQVKTWWGLLKRLETNQHFGSAIAGATGISNATAYSIPSVLMPEIAWKGYGWATNLNAYRISDIKENKVDYFRVQTLTHREGSGTGKDAQPASTSKETFWIRKDSYLLTRIVEDSKFPNFVSHTVIEYEPTVNKKIPEAAFEFGH